MQLAIHNFSKDANTKTPPQLPTSGGIIAAGGDRDSNSGGGSGGSGGGNIITSTSDADPRNSVSSSGERGISSGGGGGDGGDGGDGGGGGVGGGGGGGGDGAGVYSRGGMVLLNGDDVLADMPAGNLVTDDVSIPVAM